MSSGPEWGGLWTAFTPKRSSFKLQQQDPTDQRSASEPDRPAVGWNPLSDQLPGRSWSRGLPCRFGRCLRKRAARQSLHVRKEDRCRGPGVARLTAMPWTHSSNGPLAGGPLVGCSPSRGPSSLLRRAPQTRGVSVLPYAEILPRGHGGLDHYWTCSKHR